MSNVTDDEVFAASAEHEVKVLTVSEVAVLMAEEMLPRAQQRDAEYAPSPLLLKAVEYAQRFASNKNRETLQKIRELLANQQLSELELGLVANLGVETADEARKLIPSLDAPTDQRQAFTDEQLDSMLRELATYRQFE